jgi:hypothetical protein
MRRVAEEEKVDPTMLEETLPEIMRSSMLYHAKHKDFSVLIKMPCIEYSILAKNFTFLKTLTRSEVREYIDSGFQTWEELLMKHCT